MNLIILLTAITIILILTYIIGEKEYSWSYNTDDFIKLIACVSGVITVIALILIPILKYDTKLSIEHFKSTKATIEYQRKNATDLEKVKLSETIIDCNAWLSKEQYSCKSKWVGIYSNKSVLEPTPIE